MRLRKTTTGLSRTGRYPRPRRRALFLRRALLLVPIAVFLLLVTEWLHSPSSEQPVPPAIQQPAAPPSPLVLKPTSPSSKGEEPAPAPKKIPPAPVVQKPKKLPSEVAARLVPMPEEKSYPQGILAETVKFDQLKVNKKERKLYASRNGTIMRVYQVALGENPQGHRQTRGDRKTPEGRYSINRKDAQSTYHKSLRISYPNAEDLLRAQESGKPVGTHVYIHGLTKDTAFLGPAHRASDWTNGSVALTNEEMDELFKHTPLGTPIIIEP